jgi:hypothetical protein
VTGMTSTEIATRNGKTPKALTPKQRDEMETVLADALKPGTAGLATAISKRAWLKRGIAVAKFHRSEVDRTELPFYDFFEAVHEEILKRMLQHASNRESTWTAYHTLLERMWRDEYGKFEDKNAGGTTVVIVERPPRNE